MVPVEPRGCAFGQGDPIREIFKAFDEHLAEGPPELQQAYVRLLPVTVTVYHRTVRPEGSPAVLERLAQTGGL